MDSPVVTVFTHEKSDSTHSVRDKLGLVMGSFEDPVRGEVLRVKVIEWGVAPYDAEVTEFPEEAPTDAQGNIIYGGTYWREWGSDTPDFEPVYDRKQQELYEAEKAQLDAKQADELANVPPEKAKGYEAKHLRDQQLLAHKYGRDWAPAQASSPEPQAV